jgi:RNA polymerase sigma-70 factor, ECF subfamily
MAGDDPGGDTMAVVPHTDADTLRTTFEEVMLPHLDGVFRLARWLSANRAEAEDIVQETFVEALQSFHRFEPGSNARAWLLTIMRHVRANRLRRQRRSPIQEDADERIAQTAAVADTPQQVTDTDVLRALQDLPARFQEVVLLSDVEQLSYREIAGVLDIPIGTVMSRLHRGRRLLRVALVDCAASLGIRTSTSRMRGTSNEDDGGEGTT